MVFLKTRPFVWWNAEFTYVSSFTSLLMCITLYTVLQVTSFSLPTSNYFLQFVYSEIPGICLAGPVLVPLVLLASLATEASTEFDLVVFYTSDIWDLPTSCKKFLCFTFLFVFSVLYTKNALKSAQFSRHNTTLFDHFTVLLRTE